MTRLILSGGLLFSFVSGWAQAADESHAKKPVVAPGQEASLEKLPFTQGILKGDTLYVSGQAGFGSNGKTPEDFEEEVKTALENVGKVLHQAGYDFSDAVTVNVYLTDIGMIQRMNAVYMKYFPVPRPARTTVEVAKLVGTARVEITVTARK